MTTFTAKNATGDVVSLESLPPVGQAASAASLPVVLSTEQQALVQAIVAALAGTLAVSAASLPLPSGAATAAKQDELILAVGSPFQAGGAVTANLGTLNGAATSAKQDTQIAAIGAPDDAEWSSGNGTMIALLKAIVSAEGAALPEGANVIGGILGRTIEVSATPTVTSGSAYASGDVIGGKLTFANAVDAVDGCGVLSSVRIACKSVQTAGLKLYLFSGDPSNTTWTDDAAAAIDAADIPALIGVYSLTPDSGLGTHTLYKTDAIGEAFKVPSGTSLFGVLITTGAPNFASTSDITVALTISKG